MSSATSLNGFPKLPILSPAEIPPPLARLTSARSTAGSFYVGIAGLVLLMPHGRLVRLSDSGACATSGTDVYVLHDPQAKRVDRVQAAFRLSHDPRVNDAQRMEMCLRRDVPDLARYLLAEAVSTDAVASDPRSFALAVARSRIGPTGSAFAGAAADVWGRSGLRDSS